MRSYDDCSTGKKDENSTYHFDEGLPRLGLSSVFVDFEVFPGDFVVIEDDDFD